MTSPDSETCAGCGAPRLRGEACPQCLLRLGFSSLSQGTAPAPRRGPRPTLAPEELAEHFPALEIEECIGQGGMGAVYRARQRKLDRVVALKILAPALGHDPAFAARFLREARAMARLDHPNIVAVYDFGESDGLCWLLMEHVEGVNLRRALVSGAMTPERALAIVPQLCDALQAAHDQGVVHRDIKPENVLLDRAGRVKVVDFGLAKLIAPSEREGGLTSSDVGLGTLHYMAPEQLRAAHAVDHRADIYSLGVVLYELLTGELPIGRFAPPSHRARLDVRLDEVVLHALENEPARRYQHAAEVKTDLEALKTSETAALGSAEPTRAAEDPTASSARGLDAGAYAAPARPRPRVLRLDLSHAALQAIPIAVGPIFLRLAFDWGALALLLLGIAVVAWLALMWKDAPGLRVPRVPAPAHPVDPRRLSAATGLIACGVAAACAAVFASWELGTRLYLPPAGAFENSAFGGRWSVLALSVGSALCLLGAGAVRPRPGASIEPRRLFLPTQLSACFLLVAWTPSALGALGGPPPDVQIVGERVVQGEMHGARDRLLAHAREKGLDVDGATPALPDSATLDLAWQPARPLQRWTYERNGPRRLAPRVSWRLAPGPQPGTTWVRWNAGALRDDLPQADAWRRELEGVLALLER